MNNKRKSVKKVKFGFGEVTPKYSIHKVSCQVLMQVIRRLAPEIWAQLEELKPLYEHFNTLWTDPSEPSQWRQLKKYRETYKNDLEIMKYLILIDRVEAWCKSCNLEFDLMTDTALFFLDYLTWHPDSTVIWEETGFDVSLGFHKAQSIPDSRRPPPIPDPLMQTEREYLKKLELWGKKYFFQAKKYFKDSSIAVSLVEKDIRHFEWYVRYRCQGKNIEEIALEFFHDTGDESTIRKGIKSIADLLGV